ncbi:isochorismatase family protein [Loigolactobacillus bifermentans]|uniref:Isochorismatase hydrolase n=1 Tax=Loigolactobacillus bifermentans DSM 20003 TaxID=1423726 RepID=A0A0R1GN12_9LACO|nr:isochorismatase family protein [Loigolactobacillus bifermentans]KRK32706.1 isochorismatase hydrolase [Loigolactobacillus bifermentans DSM 20003]QGG59855.1 isochorismatase family protein [Loigolactobacillus bifermentans]
MTSDVRRDPLQDELLTPENAVLTLIDYQPMQINAINSIAHATLIKNTQALINLMQAFKVPIILSTVNVATSQNEDTIPALKRLLPDIPSYDRTSINAWEDVAYQQAVKATGRRKIVIGALWTEACMAFPTLDALAAGFDVFPVVDAIGGTSTLAHETALRRVEQAGAQLTTLAQLGCELQRDWNRHATARDFVRVMREARIFVDFHG